MNWFVCLLGAGLSLCLQSQVNAGESSSAVTEELFSITVKPRDQVLCFVFCSIATFEMTVKKEIRQLVWNVLGGTHQLTQPGFLSAEYLFSRTDIERAVMAAKTNVDSAYQYSRQEYVH